MTQVAAGSGTSDFEAPVGDAPHWLDGIPQGSRKSLCVWLWSIAAMTFAVLVVGGITRLTLSGLSIVDWNPVMGVIPPLSEADWQQAFDAYRQFPEYQQTRQGMSLAEFKFIYFWEYLHRLLARGIGIVFLVPFVVFLVRRTFNPPLLRRVLLLFGLGAMQGVMGWAMVASGLVDRPSVSHYRLAAHLSLAFLIFGYAVWLARELAIQPRPYAPDAEERRLMRRGLGLVGVVFALQVVWGAFVAGLRAGKYYPTFPLMGGRLVPTELFWLDPPLANFFANAIAVQWTHRVIGTVLLLAVVYLGVRVLGRVRDPVSRRYAAAFTALMAVQYGLGIATLLLVVPVSLGVIHQATAMILFGVWLAWLHHVVRSRAGAGTATTPSERPLSVGSG